MFIPASDGCEKQNSVGFVLGLESLGRNRGAAAMIFFPTSLSLLTRIFRVHIIKKNVQIPRAPTFNILITWQNQSTGQWLQKMSCDCNTQNCSLSTVGWYQGLGFDESSCWGKPIELRADNSL